MSTSPNTEIEKERFKDALLKSKGKTNNSFAWDLVCNSDATTDDIVRLGNKRGNEGFYKRRFYSVSYSQEEINRILVKKHQKRQNFRRLTDYKWFFNNAKYEDLDDTENLYKFYIGTIIDKVETEMANILSMKDGHHRLTWESCILYAYKIGTDIFYNSYYFDKRMVEYVDRKDLGLGQIGLRDEYMKISTKRHSDKHAFINYTYNLDSLKRSTIKDYLELCEKISLSELVMYSYAGLDKNARSVASCLTEHRIRDYANTDKVYNAIMDLMKTEGTYRILVEMGVALVKDGNMNVRRKDLSKIHNRVRKMYKQFTSSKTLEARQNIRDLMIEQLNLIAHDFGHSAYKFEKMDCTTWQDEDFTKTLTKKETKNVTARGIASGTKINLDDINIEVNE